MDNETLRALAGQFTNVKSRPGRNGQQLSYLEGHSIIQRLNEALEGEWSFRVLEHHVLDDTVVVLGELAASGLTKQAFGGSGITRSRDGGTPIDLADDLKAAATDALKKAATLFGIGLYLYGDEEKAPGTTKDRGNGGSGVPGNGNDKGHENTNANGNGSRLTRKQLAYIHSLGRELGIDRLGLDDLARAEHGKTAAHLSVQEASGLIKSLQHDINGGGDHAQPQT
jgi:Rad52/22 family double-strand break repair protein